MLARYEIRIGGRLDERATAAFAGLDVADRGSINRAARRLRLGQPQLSLQLANLEKFLGHRLFERQAQGSALTEEGREVYQSALQLLSALESFRTEVNGTSFVSGQGVENAMEFVSGGTLRPPRYDPIGRKDPGA